jgi:hypothetical protein
MAAPASVVQEKELITCTSPASPFDKWVASSSQEDLVFKIGMTDVHVP